MQNIKPKAILFDAGDVLYYRPNRDRQFSAFLSALGLPFVPRSDPRRRALRQKAYIGQLSEKAYYEAILDLCCVVDPVQREIGRSILYQSTRDFVYFPGVAETLQRLKSSGFHLGVVTNTFNATKEKLAWFHEAGFESVWDSFATSCELGVTKPNPRIYLAALDPLGIGPLQAAFVGHAQRELEGAKALGLTTIAFNRDEEAVCVDYIIDCFSELLTLFNVDKVDCTNSG